MTRAERKELSRLRNKGGRNWTIEEYRRALVLTKMDRDERRVLDPIKPQEKKR